MTLCVPQPRPLTRGQHDRLNLYAARSIRLDRTIEVVGPASYELWLLLEWDASLQAVCERPLVLHDDDDHHHEPDFWIKPKGGAAYYASIVANDYLARDASGCLVPREEVTTGNVRQVGGLAMQWISDGVLRDRIIAIRNVKYLHPYATEASLWPDLKVREAAFRRVKTRGSVSCLNVETDLHDYGTHRVRCELALLLHQGRITTPFEIDLFSSANILSAPS